MRVPLVLHPESRCDALDSVSVEVERRSSRRIGFRFELEGRLRHLRFPWVAVPAKRTDGLWTTTCFEAFLKPDGQDAYIECNFSPKTHWNIYRFDGYRIGVEEARGGIDPHVGANLRSDRSAYLEAELDLSRMAWIPDDRPWRLGLSAVIEERSGNKSYWALRHPQGQPDFHHPDCFALELAPARPA